MAETGLEALPILGGYNQRFGDFHPQERDELAVVSLAIPLGGEAKATEALKDAFGVELPTTLSSLNVDLSVAAEAISGGATASFIDQTFDISSEVVPEPASFVIWVGALAMAFVIPFTYRRWKFAAETNRLR